MIIYTFSFTENGNKLNNRIISLLKDDEVEVKPYFTENVRGRLTELTGDAFNNADALIFIGAVGIAVRAISAFVKSKAVDPAVIVCDERGSFVVPILSGHIGGANELAFKLSKELNAIPVITTATDINKVWAVDTWAVKNGFKVNNIDQIKYISSAMLRGEKVGMESDVKIDETLPDNLVWNDKNVSCGIVISPYLRKPFEHTLNLIPKCLSVGVGSKKNSDEQALCKLLERVLAENEIDSYAIERVATIDIKRNEPAVLRLCESLGTELICYSSDALNSIDGDFASSEFVKNVTGTDNVCERSAIMALGSGKIIVNKTVGEGVTLSVAVREDKNTEECTDS